MGGVHCPPYALRGSDKFKGQVVVKVMAKQAYDSPQSRLKRLIDHIGDEKIPIQMSTAVGNISQWPKG